MSENKRILIIEDDRDICRTVELHLSSLGFKILKAFDGRDGLEQAKRSRPDLIILDLGLPHLPGEEICRELRKDEECQEIPIIMVTAKGTDVDRVIGRVIGADYYISKPFDLDVLEEKVKILLNKTAAKALQLSACGEKIKTETTKMLGRVFIRGNIPEIDQDCCTGCALCVTQCQKIGLDALELKEGVAKVVRPEKCIGDGSCMLACPVKAIFLLSHHDPALPPKRFVPKMCPSDIETSRNKPKQS
jgi:CheY-like chemotaxis protein